MIPTRPFGRTGHESTRVIFGAAALGGMSPARADATIDLVTAAVLGVAARLGDPVSAPAADSLDADRIALGLEPIFDGGALERI